MVTGELTKGKQTKIDLRINNSRPRIGEGRRMAITLPPETWDKIDQLVSSEAVKSQAEAIRLILNGWADEVGQKGDCLKC